MIVSIAKTTSRAAPNAVAARFERELLGHLAAARSLEMEKDSFLLLDGRDRVLLRYLRADGVSR